MDNHAALRKTIDRLAARYEAATRAGQKSTTHDASARDQLKPKKEG